MDNEIGTARVGIEVDSSRAESGLTRIEAATTRTGRAIRNFGEQGSNALDNVGAGGAAAATRVENSARSLISSIERTTAALNAGKKGSSEYFEEMARLRGVDLSALTPSLTGLREAEAAQVRLAAAAEQVRVAQERAATAARAEAQAQREAAQAAASREQFIAGLREQVALYGQSQEAVLRYRAAQLGAAEAAEPLIRQLREQRQAQEQVTSAAMATAQAQREMALAQNARDTFVADLERQAEAIGRTRAELLELRAAQLGVSDQAAPFIQRLREAEGGLERTGNTARQTAAAMRGVPAQFTDIVVSLQGGQAPLTVLLQQGGQLVDMFGGIQEAARGMGQHLLKLVNPYTVAAAAIAIAGVAYHDATEEADAYILALTKTGNQAGLTADKLGTMAESIAKSGGTQAAAAEALVTMVGAGNIAAADMERFTKIALGSQKLLGVAVADTAAAFADLGKDPIAASQKLDAQMNYLSLSLTRQIRELQELGEFEKAAALAQSSYADAMEQRNARIKASMGALETAWGASVGGMKKAWDLFVGVFRADTLAEQIEKAQGAVSRAQAARYTFMGSGPLGAKALADAKKQLQELLDMQERMNRIGKAEANRQSEKEAGNRWDTVVDQYKTPKAKLDDEETRIRNLGKAANATQKQIDDVVAQSRKSFTDSKANEAIELQIAALQRRGAVEEELAKRSRMLLESKHASGLVAEEQYIQALETLDIGASEREKKRLQDELRLVAGKKDSGKEQIDLRSRLAVLDESIATRRLQTEDQLNAMEVKRNRTAAQNYADTVERAAGARDSISGQLTAQLDYNNSIGKTAQQLAEIAAARLMDSAATAEQNAAIADGLDLSGSLSEIYRKQAEELRALAGAKLAEPELQSTTQGLKDLEAFLDPTRPKEFGDALRDAFGGAGSALVSLTTSLESFGQKQEEIEKMRGNAAKAYLNGGDEKKYLEQIAALNKRQTQDRLRGYGDMAAAAAGFFGEQSRGYKALTTMSQVFHAAELAATVAELVPKGISAVLSQGQGDPYTAFGRMAAMAAIVAGLGVAIGGIGGSSGGGGTSAADMQKAQGTGSVFGDSKAQSDSIAASLEALEQNSDSLIPINKGMLDALRAIEASMTGLTNLVVRVPGLVEGENLGITTGDMGLTKMPGHFMPVGGWEIGANLWGKVKQTIVDSGLQFGGSVRDLQAGNGYQQYASVDTTKSSFFGLKKKTSNSVEVAGLSDELSAQFGLVFTNVEKALSAAAVGMGVGADHVTKVLDGLSIEMTKVSLKGLTGDDLTAAISAVISKATDDMASAVFPELESFRQVGEGYAETVIRLASNYGLVDSALESLGMQFGAVGLGSIAARERLIELSGGIDALTEQASSFADNYLTEAERLAPVQKYVAEQMAAMGQASVTTKDQFKALVLGLNVSTEAGAKQYATLMGVADAFAAVAEAAEKAAEARSDLEGQIYDLTHTAVEATARQRQLELAAMDASLRPLQERVYALQDEKAAADALADANKGYQTQIDAILKSRMSEAEIRAIETAGMDASTIALYDRLKALQGEQSAIAAAKASADSLGQSLAQMMGTVEKSIQNVLQSMLDTLSGIQDARVSAQDAIRTARLSGMSPAGRLEALRAEEASLFGQLGTASDPAAVAAKLQAVILQRIQEEVGLSEKLNTTAVDTLKEQISGYEKLQSMAEQFAQFTSTLRFGDLSALNNTDQLGAAQALYQRTLAAATGGDENALSNLTGNAQAYLEEAKSYYASSGDYAKIFADVLGSIDALGAADYDPQLAAAKEELAAMEQVDASVLLSSKLTIDAMTRLDAGLAERQAKEQAAMEKQLALAKQQIDELKKVSEGQGAQIEQAAAVARQTAEKLDAANALLARLADSASLAEANQ